MIYTVGIRTAFFMGLLLLTKLGKTFAHKVLTCWLFLIGIHLSFFYLFFSKTSYQHPFLLALDAPLPLLHGPLLFFYTASLTNQLAAKKKHLFLHFIPAIICCFYLTCYFYLLPSAQKIYIFQHEGVGF